MVNNINWIEIMYYLFFAQFLVLLYNTIIFTSSYEMEKEEDYEEWEWAGWKLKYDKSYEKSDELDRRWMENSGIGYVIPYTKRGKKIIENLDEALQAAINMSKDLS